MCESLISSIEEEGNKERKRERKREGGKEKEREREIRPMDLSTVIRYCLYRQLNIPINSSQPGCTTPGRTYIFSNTVR